MSITLNLLNDPTGLRYKNTADYETKALVQIYRRAPHRFLVGGTFHDATYKPAGMDMAIAYYAAAQSLLEDSDDQNNLVMAKQYMELFGASL